MRGSLVETNSKLGQILRIVLLGDRKIATIQFFDASRMKIDLDEYMWDEEKKVWKKT